MSKLLVLQPTRGILFTKAQEALETELAANGLYPNVLRTEDIPLPDSRNVLVESALALPEWRYALLLDDDVIMPEGSLAAMMEALTDGSGTKIAVIDYPHHLAEIGGKKLGTAVYKNWKEGDPVEGLELAWAGLGCTMVKREVLEKMDRPHFQGSAYGYQRGEDGELKMLQESKGNINESNGEDVFFFFNARKLGLKVRVLTRFQAGHARIEKFVYRLAGGKYRTTHKIAVNSSFERPEV